MKIGTLCYIVHEGKVLLLHRNKKENDMHAGKYVGVGGKVEEHEAPTDCIKREALEETGFVIDPVLRGVVSWPGDVDGSHWTGFIFVATQFAGRQVQDCNEGTLEWVDLRKLKEVPMWEGDHHIIQSALDEKKKFFYLEQFYENGKFLKEHSIFY